jgi:hypothetical protein
MWDDQPDGAGYYAADLAEMAHKTKRSVAAASSKKNTGNGPADDKNNNSSNEKARSRHAQVAMYLRRVCSRATLHSCRVLNIPLEQEQQQTTNNENRIRVIRRAYHEAVRRCHPDKRRKAQRQRQRQNHGGVQQQQSSLTTSTNSTTSTTAAHHSSEATLSMTENSHCCYSTAGDMESSSAINDERFLQVTAAYRHLMHMDEQEEDHDNYVDAKDDVDRDKNGVSAVAGSGSGGNSRRYCNQRAIPFLLPPSTTLSQPSPPAPPFLLDTVVVEATNDVRNDEPHGPLDATNSVTTTDTTTTSLSCTNSADDEAWLTQSRLRIVLQQYGRCGSRGNDDDDNGGGGGANATTAWTTTTAGRVVEEQQGGLDLSNLRKWWNRCWPDVPLPVTANKHNLKAWIKTQHAVVYMRRDDKGVIRLYIQEEKHRGRQQQQQQHQRQ